MDTEPKIRRFTETEYLALEDAAPFKSEFVNGEILAMSGADPQHSLIMVNLISELRAALRDRPCRTYGADLRVKVDPTGAYVYPDVVVICGEGRFTKTGGVRAALNPTLIVEILSRSTEGNDRGWKWFHYQELESLTTYLLVAQSHPRVECYSRQPDGAWRYSQALGRTEKIALPALGRELPLEEIYRQVELEADEPEAPDGAADIR